MVKVNNVPDYAKTRRFWVVKIVDGEYWFYGAFNDVTKAYNSCREFGNCTLSCTLIENTEISK